MGCRSLMVCVNYDSVGHPDVLIGEYATAAKDALVVGNSLVAPPVHPVVAGIS